MRENRISLSEWLSKFVFFAFYPKDFYTRRELSFYVQG
jgi:alkyl hydroperoxide reductase subunit AhpC